MGATVRLSTKCGRRSSPTDHDGAIFGCFMSLFLNRRCPGPLSRLNLKYHIHFMPGQLLVTRPQFNSNYHRLSDITPRTKELFHGLHYVTVSIPVHRAHVAIPGASILLRRLACDECYITPRPTTSKPYPTVPILLTRGPASQQSEERQASSRLRVSRM